MRFSPAARAARPRRIHEKRRRCHVALAQENCGENERGLSCGELVPKQVARYLIQSYENIRPSVEALRYRFMDTAVYRNRAFDEHQKILELLTTGNISKACDILDDHISRTKHFHARVNWSSGRSQRKDYKFRDYTAILAD
jgi:hypothetical protein